MGTPNGPTGRQHLAMHRLWCAAGVPLRADRLALTEVIVRRPLQSSRDLTSREADSVLTYLRRLDAEGRLATTAAEYLARAATPTESRRTA